MPAPARSSRGICGRGSRPHGGPIEEIARHSLVVGIRSGGLLDDADEAGPAAVVRPPRTSNEWLATDRVSSAAERGALPGPQSSLDLLSLDDHSAERSPIHSPLYVLASRKTRRQCWHRRRIARGLSARTRPRGANRRHLHRPRSNASIRQRRSRGSSYSARNAEQRRLYFFALPHGHDALGEIFGSTRRTVPQWLVLRVRGQVAPRHLVRLGCQGRDSSLCRRCPHVVARIGTAPDALRGVPSMLSCLPVGRRRRTAG